MTKRDMLKDDIVDTVLRAGTAIGVEKIANRVSVPEGDTLKSLLDELVAEGRLVSRFTLMNNGERTQMYNVRVQ